MSKLSVAFTPDEAVEATKDFVGQIVAAEYGLGPLGMTGRPDLEQRAQMAIQIRTEEYEKDQYEWYSPSNKKMTKWVYFVEALAKTGALREISSAGKANEEKLKSFADSLVGMKFRFLEHVKLEGIARPIDRLILPEEYFGREAVSAVKEIAVEEVKL